MLNYLQISDNQIFSTVLHSIAVTGNSISLSAINVTLPSGTYYWRIKTVINDQPDTYTFPNRFDVKTFDNNYLLSVTDGINNIQQNVTDVTSATLNQYLDSDTTYSWSVTGNGTISVESQNFTTLNLINQPANADIIRNIDNSITLTWASVIGATGYKVLYKMDYHSDYNGTGLTLDADGLIPANSPVIVAETETSLTLYNLLADTTYWFAIQATDARGDSTPLKIPGNVSFSASAGGQTVLPAPADIDLVVDQETHDMTITWTQEEQ
jgi:hypothetical protein